MVLENLLGSKLIERRPFFSFFLGLLFTFIGFIFAAVFFKEMISVAMLFLVTLLLVPALIKLINIEEKRERKEGLKNFVKDHRDIFEIYIFSFLGVFVGFLLLSLYFSDSATGSLFDFQLNLLQNQGLNVELITEFMERPLQPSLIQVANVAGSNLLVNIICFLLSFFYGAGAIFLIIVNASVFSSFVSYIIQHLSQKFSMTLSIFGAFLVHMIPEISGFLLAAIAGGVISKAILAEKFGSKGFKNVVKDGTLLLLIACGLTILAAFLEVYVTTFLFKAL